MTSVSVSVDDLDQTHDKLRGREGSWRRCLDTIGFAQKAGIYAGANSQINRLSAPEFPLLYEALLRNFGDPKGGLFGKVAGMNSLGIEADGAVKGCPSLPTKAYTGGNIRDVPLVENRA